MTSAKLIQDRKSAGRRLAVSSQDCNRTGIEISWLPSEAQTIDCHPVDIGDAVPHRAGRVPISTSAKTKSHPRTLMQPSLKKSNRARGAQAGSLAHETGKKMPRRYLREVMRRLHCDPALSFAEYTEAEEALALPEGKAQRTEADVHALGLVWNER